MKTPFEFGSYKTVGGYDASVYERIKYDGKLFLYGSVRLHNDTYREAPMFWDENGEVYVPDGKWTLDDKVWIFSPRCKGKGLALLYSTKTYDYIFQSPRFNLTTPKPEPTNDSKLTPPIKPGKYKMRNGKQAIVAAIAPSEMNLVQPLTGRLKYSDKNWTPACWKEGGEYHSTSSDPSQFDLIAPWIDAPIFNHWDKVPWAKCVYRNDDYWFATTNEMERIQGGWIAKEVITDSYGMTLQLKEKHYPNWAGLDKDSLILRPANV